MRVNDHRILRRGGRVVGCFSIVTLLMLCLLPYYSLQELFRQFTLDLQARLKDVRLKNEVLDQAVARDDASEGTPGGITLPTERFDCGCPDTCDDSALSKTMNGIPFSCKARIKYLMERYGDSHSRACAAAVNEGACGPECDQHGCMMGHQESPDTSTEQSDSIKASYSNQTIEKCALWHDNLDSWWQDHPDWQIAHENDTHTCFAPILLDEKAEIMRHLHEIQFNSNCSLAIQRYLVSSGYAATMNRLTSTFWHAFHQGRPFVRSKHWPGAKWMYSPSYNESDPHRFGGCPTQDMFCYFLNITSCEYDANRGEDSPRGRLIASVKTAFDEREEDVRVQYRWLMTYFTRQRQETRYRLRQLMKQIAPTPELPCVAFHVRRADAASEPKHPREFYPLSTYIEMGNVSKRDNIVLLTDDQSTLDEAKFLHPEHNFFYIDRQRFFGVQKVNNHIPSGDPASEFLNILADIKMAEKCDRIVHGTSNLVEFIVQNMEEVQDRIVSTIQVDKGADFRKTQPRPAKEFMKELEQKLDDARIRNRTER